MQPQVWSRYFFRAYLPLPRSTLFFVQNVSKLLHRATLILGDIKKDLVSPYPAYLGGTWPLHLHAPSPPPKKKACLHVLDTTNWAGPSYFFVEIDQLRNFSITIIYTTSTSLRLTGSRTVFNMSDDKGPLLRNSCYVFMALVAVLATMRFYVRLRLQGQWKFHDWLFTFALVRMLSCFLSGVLELTLKR